MHTLRKKVDGEGLDGAILGRDWFPYLPYATYLKRRLNHEYIKATDHELNLSHLSTSSYALVCTLWFSQSVSVHFPIHPIFISTCSLWRVLYHQPLLAPLSRLDTFMELRLHVLVLLTWMTFWAFLIRCLSCSSADCSLSHFASYWTDHILFLRPCLHFFLWIHLLPHDPDWDGPVRWAVLCNQRWDINKRFDNLIHENIMYVSYLRRSRPLRSYVPCAPVLSPLLHPPHSIKTPECLSRGKNSSLTRGRGRRPLSLRTGSLLHHPLMSLM